MRGLRQPYVVAVKKGDRQGCDFFEKKKITLREGFITETEEPIDPLIGPLSGAILQCEEIHRASAALTK
jgi:translation initiation factor IF-2